MEQQAYKIQHRESRKITSLSSSSSSPPFFYRGSSLVKKHSAKSAVRPPSLFPSGGGEFTCSHNFPTASPLSLLRRKPAPHGYRFRLVSQCCVYCLTQFMSPSHQVSRSDLAPSIIIMAIAFLLFHLTTFVFLVCLVPTHPCL